MEINYFRKYDLNKEPFSSAPDPDFLYQSRQHFGVMQQLENAIRNKSGVNLITGAQGTGKTTLLRHLYRKLSHEKNMDVHLLNAEFWGTQSEFEQQIVKVFGHFEKDPFVHTLHPDMHFNRLVETLREKTHPVVLFIDNGHMITREGLSVLLRLAGIKRNGEENVQLLIFADRTIMDNINESPEFKSKISQYNVLGPMSFNDTRHMINHRLKVAGNSIKQAHLFTYPALLAIYIATGGYPKKIVKLCHRLILSMSIKKSMKAGWFQVRFCARKVLSKGSLFPDIVLTSCVFLLISVGAFFFFNSFGNMAIVRVDDTGRPAVASTGPQVAVPDIADNPVDDGLAKKITPDVDESVDPEPVASLDPVPVEQSVTPLVVETEEVPDPVISQPVDEPVYSFPEDLGTVEVKRGDTLLVMLEKVYGHSRSIYRREAFKANEHFADLNNLAIGDRIIFPVIVAQVTPMEEDSYWVKIANFSSLDQAFDYIRAWPSRAPKIKMIPYFRKDSGLTVDVVLKQLFFKELAAQNVANDLAPFPVHTMEVTQYELKESTYFSDPYFK